MSSAFLGVSIGSPYYSKDRIRAYLALAKLRFDSFAFLVGDDIARYTIAATRGVSLLIAKRLVDETTKNLSKMLVRTADEVGIHTEIFRWSRVQALSGYKEILSAVESEFQQSDLFRASVRNQVWINLGSRIAIAGVGHEAGGTNSASMFCDRYILEEIAGLIAMSEFTPYALEIYPGEDLMIMEMIYGDKFPIIAAALPHQRKRRFECIRINID